jgi:hypothetical protein
MHWPEASAFSALSSPRPPWNCSGSVAAPPAACAGELAPADRGVPRPARGILPAMEQVLIELGAGPALVALATLATRRHGARVGGIVSAFPAIVGPVLLVLALNRGPGFAARAADATLLGLAALAAFALVYGRTARAHDWRICCLAGWGAAALTAAILDAASTRLGTPPGILVAAVSLLAAYLAMPDGGAPAPLRHRSARGDLPARMIATAALVSGLAAAANHLGPLIGGVLAAPPVLASVLAVFTHRQLGPHAATGLLRGMLAGMPGFVVFCEAVRLLIVTVGLWPAFALATAAALLVQAALARLPDHTAFSSLETT